jgi:hypothetical protein
MKVGTRHLFSYLWSVHSTKVVNLDEFLDVNLSMFKINTTAIILLAPRLAYQTIPPM